MKDQGKTDYMARVLELVYDARQEYRTAADPDTPIKTSAKAFRQLGATLDALRESANMAAWDVTEMAHEIKVLRNPSATVGRILF